MAPRLIALPLALCTAPDLWLAAAWQLRFLRFCRHSFNPYPTQFTSVYPSILGFGLAFLTHSNLTATSLGTHLNIQPFEHVLGPWQHALHAVINKYKCWKLHPKYPLCVVAKTLRFLLKVLHLPFSSILTWLPTWFGFLAKFQDFSFNQFINWEIMGGLS